MRNSDMTSKLKALADAGQPVVDLVLEEAMDIGEIFCTWEFATGVAGALVGIDAFDQPNVQESKDNTKRLLEEFKSSGTMHVDQAQIKPDDAAAIGALLGSVKPGDYIALTEYFTAT